MEAWRADDCRRRSEFHSNSRSIVQGCRSLDWSLESDDIQCRQDNESGQVPGHGPLWQNGRKILSLAILPTVT